ncbi:COG3014 family protein [Thermophagus sp. OGC60D27]|uniref:COG3014 family protein n=1 Tax=Thermophagus sp. OGC60D27 TaxID=3458415 RepID=UPI004037FE64
MNRYLKVISTIALVAIIAACATFYQKTYQIQENIAKGQFDKADKLLEKDTKWAQNNNRVLYFMNRGVVAYMMGEYGKSINYFNQADYYIEDYSKQFGWEALSLVSNPMVKPYRPEDFEVIMIHFYKALNFIALNDLEGALVEARRINIRLQQLNDKYKDYKNKYQRDAFAHNLMGMIFEAAKDYNNAFIAYRNAFEVYEGDYSELFGLSVPQQLKKDLLRTAKLSGFPEEVTRFENLFDMKTPEVHKNDEGQLLLFWLNGMGPVKSEWYITVTNFGFNNGLVALGNPELGLNFAYQASALSPRERAAFKNLSFFSVAFPKYVERSPVFRSGKAMVKDTIFTFEIAEDINKIAFQCLHDRMFRELGNALLRVATKKALEKAVNNENENLGTIVSIINTLTERADTRNWQSLPYSISYTRIYLPEGQHTINLNFAGEYVNNNTIDVNIKAGQTTFYTFHTMSSKTMN